MDYGTRMPCVSFSLILLRRVAAEGTSLSSFRFPDNLSSRHAIPFRSMIIIVPRMYLIKPFTHVDRARHKRHQHLHCSRCIWP